MYFKVHTIVNEPVPSNCHIVYNENGHAIVVDPGSQHPDKIKNYITSNNLVIDYVILTHEHFDHIWSVDTINAPVICTSKCAEMISDSKRNLSFFYKNSGFALRHKCITVEELNWELNWGTCTLKFIPSTAHSQGGMLSVLPPYLFSGDLLIYNTKVVTKILGGDKQQLPVLHEQLSKLMGMNLIVCAGHGCTFDLDNYDIKNIF
jgi:glyoxylase-like metal-dependent hydrolase (beta-lactamase superfamily II)